MRTDRLLLKTGFMLSLLLFRPNLAMAADEFSVKSVSTQLNDTVFFLNAVYEIQLPDYIRSAFEQGFELPMSVDLEVYEDRTFWLDKRVVYFRQQYRLQYHSILDSVSMMNVNAGNRQFFTNLDEALSHLSVMLNYPMLDLNRLNRSKSYWARLRFGIDTEALPIPLKSSSLWQNDWELVSDWYQWEVVP